MGEGLHGQRVTEQVRLRHLQACTVEGAVKPSRERKRYASDTCYYYEDADTVRILARLVYHSELLDAVRGMMSTI